MAEIKFPEPNERQLNFFEQEIEKFRRKCGRNKRRKIEEHIQQLATNYRKEHPNLLVSREVIIADVLGKD
ncbi:MAG: hypothetical protein C5B43_01440 [Verrucomicrobia bacterium]|nr:MAG: hypothetical protein C5B43_01440 [Verrucomicrobiota bacterium]